MRNGWSVAVVIPALNEEPSIGRVLDAIPDWVDDVIVADNGSTDRTAAKARTHGARVVHEPRRGYGSACLKAMAALEDPDIVVFLDGDYSDYPQEMDRLVDPIIEDEADAVIGSRVLGNRERGALTPQARFGNSLSCVLIRLIWGVTFTDLGPFRAVKYSTLNALDMEDPDYGWTVEMQIKAARDRVRVVERPVSYRKRIGKSKVSGTVRGVIGAGTKILSTIFLAAAGSIFHRPRPVAPERLIVFSRYPKAGETKTRLVPALGPNGAAELQRKMTEHTVSRLIDSNSTFSRDTEVRFFGGNSTLMQAWLGRGPMYTPQGRGDLGEKLIRASADAFRRGVRRVVVIGTDCPDLSSKIVDEAFRALKSSDTVFGPASDGGYYLVGLRAPNPSLFVNIPWGTDRVYAETKAAARDAGLTFAELEMLTDVDTPEDLHVWERVSGELVPRVESSEAIPGLDSGVANRDGDPAEPSETGSRISVIVPTLNEASQICSALVRARTGRPRELIVVDGGSDDATVEYARALGAVVLSAQPGRAGQMNMGAEHATGDVLLFLHADTLLPDGWEEAAGAIANREDVVGGAFSFQLDERLPASRIIEQLTNFRCRAFGMPYGDQGLFVRTDVFRALGGFPDIPIMEDFEFVKRLKRRGTVLLVDSPAVTSARRWRHCGMLRTTLLNQVLIVAYTAGRSSRLLQRLKRLRDKGGRRD